MAYRVTTEPANRAQPATARKNGDRALSRNVAIATVTLGCVCLAAAGVAVLGRNHEAGSLPNYVASHKALKIAWVEPEQQAQFERNPNIAANSPGPKDQSTQSTARPGAEPDARAASRFDAAVGQLAANAPAIPPSQVPLPHARPRRAVAAKAPAPEAPATVAVAAAAEPAAPLPSAERDESAERAKSTQQAMTLMSYAPATSEQLFAPEVTGSIGNPLRDLVPAAKHDEVPLPTKAPQLPPHDKSSALKTKILPEPVVKLAKPSRKLTIAEKLWGPVQVASLGPLSGVGEDGLGRDGNGIPKAPYNRQTAVYVITHKKVYMPDGSVLEAHSGLGDKMDDPRFAHVRMRGVTPPHVYDLKMREALFHGVEAIRMTPIGGEEAIFGRDGILAHTYMLGPSGQSNGCISFKDYDEFLDAFKAGKVNRIAVIAKLD
jgi:hypothetical protein